METMNMTLAGNIGGASMSSTVVREATAQFSQSTTVAAAKTGALTTRTSDSVGTLTMDAGHGLTTGAVIDLFWDGGCRYNITVGTVDTNSVPLTDSGAGDVLPADETDITASVQTTLDLDFDGDLLVAIGAKCAQAAVLQFMVDTTAELIVVLAANEAWTWWDGGSAVNPLAGHDVTSVQVSQGGSSAAAAFVLGGLYNSEI